MDLQLLYKFADKYRHEILAEDGHPQLLGEIADLSDQQLLEKLAQYGVTLDRDAWNELTAEYDGVEDVLIEELFDDADPDPQAHIREYLRELWRRWSAPRVCLDDIVDATAYLGLCYPERDTDNNAPTPTTESTSPSDTFTITADETIALVTSLLDWLTAGPVSARELFEELERFYDEVGIALEAALAGLARTHLEPALALSERLAQATGTGFDWGLHADILADAGRLSEAEAIYDKATALEPWNVWLLKNAAMMFAGSDTKPPADARKARERLDRAETLAHQRLADFRQGKTVVFESPPPDGQTDKTQNQEDDEIDPRDLERRLLEDLEIVLDEQYNLAKREGDTSRAGLYEKRIEQFAADRSRFDDLDQDDLDEDQDDGDEPDGGDNDDGGNDDNEPDGDQRGPSSSATVRSVEPALTRAQTVGRNDPCVCGSGIKYKKCCWLVS